MRIINKKYLLTILLVGVILTGVIFLKPKEEVKLDNVILKQEVNNKTFAMYTETDNGYQEYEGNKFPSGYRLNKDKSKCIDNNGEEIENAIYTENNQIGVKSNKSFYCYLYFDEKENLSNICNGSTMEECMSNNKDKIMAIENLSDLTSELYRYHGLDVDNYICFGTNDKEQCLSNQDKYLYRIIGINKDGNLKLIKNTSIEKMQWNDKSSKEECGEDGENCTWEKSTLKNYLNTEFLTNSIPIEWQDKIAEVNWNIGVTNNYTEKPYAEKLYEQESKNQTSETSKIGLMYMTDHYYAYDDGEGITNCDTSYCNSWLHNNSEWTMTFYGFYDKEGKNTSCGVIYSEQIGVQNIKTIQPIRPVFYLTNTLNLTGLGTIESPYIINIT